MNLRKESADEFKDYTQRRVCSFPYGARWTTFSTDLRKSKRYPEERHAIGVVESYLGETTRFGLCR